MTTPTKSNSFLDAVVIHGNSVENEKGSPAFKSTLNAMLDFFGQGGACRGDSAKFLSLFWGALAESPTYALRCLFYLRDIRGGQGERDIVRNVFREVANEPSLVDVIIPFIPTYGRWDDLEIFIGTAAEGKALAFWAAQLNADMAELADEGKKAKISLAGKWAPSINTSSRSTCAKGNILRTSMGLTFGTYRRMLSTLRAHIDVVECHMSANNWKRIEYAKVPSKAATIYRKAFLKRDQARYQAYLDALAAGETKVNASTLSPHELVTKVATLPKDDVLLEAQWKALPDYLAKSPHKGIAICDVSGSMEGKTGNAAEPIMVAMALSIYIAERCEGPFQNKFFTFHEQPELCSLVGTSLRTRVQNLKKAEWGGTTNLQSVFDLMLTAAKRPGVKKSDMPDVLYIISDMQFDTACNGWGGKNPTNFEAIDEAYRVAGFVRPKIVFWNVRASGNVPITQIAHNVALVSGYNPTMFQQIIAQSSPVGVMMDVLDSERYAAISVGDDVKKAD